MAELNTGEYRRYILSKKETMPVGISATTTTTLHDIIDGFTYNDIEYPSIDISELAIMSEADYIDRRNAFLSLFGMSQSMYLSLQVDSVGEDTDSCPLPDDTTTTTSLIFPELVIGFNVTYQDSTISFDLEGEQATFTATRIPNYSNNEFLSGVNSGLTASSFYNTIATYLTNNNIGNKYSVEFLSEDASVKIKTKQTDSSLNFGTVTITNKTGALEKIKYEGSGVLLEENKTFFYPSNPTDRLSVFNIPKDNTLVVVDFDALTTPDALELIVNDAVSATTNMYSNSNYGYPTVGSFRLGSFDDEEDIRLTNLTKINALRNHLDEFYIGEHGNHINGGLIPDRINSFKADTGKSIPMAIFDTGIAQQRIWIKNINKTDRVEMHVTNGIPDISVGNHSSHFVDSIQIVQSNQDINDTLSGSFTVDWIAEVKFVIDEESNIALLNQVSI